MRSPTAAIRRRVGLGAAIAFLAVVSIGLQSQPPATTLTLAWDPGDASTQGYRVHVGTSSRTYERTYDVGPATSFTFGEGVPGTVYYFTVSAYDAAGRSSGYSNEVSAAVGGGGGAPPVETHENVGPEPSGRDPWKLKESDRAMAREAKLEAVGGMAALPDGRVLVIEKGRRIHLLAPDGTPRPPALSVDADATALIEVVVDAAFDRTRVIYVGMTEPRPDGLYDFHVVRYRLVGNALGEGATIVAGLTFSGNAPPRVAVDGLSRIYVAMPADDEARAGAYAGRILRVAADGSVPDDHPAHSPVLAEGVAVPLDLDWDGHALWVVGRDTLGRPVTGRLQPDAPDAPWPRRLDETGLESDHGLEVAALEVPSGATSATPWYAVSASSPRRLYRLTSDDGTSVTRVESLDWPDDSEPLDVLVDREGTVHVAARRTTGRVTVVRMPGHP